MIARTWHGRTKASDADRYLQFLEATGLKDYAAVDGNLGVKTLRRIDGDFADFLIITFWASMDAVKRFAGENPEIAVYYPDDDVFLVEKEQYVTHHEVVFES